MDQNDNLIIALHRWAHRQDENFTTEAFVYVMKHLQKYRPLAVSRILAKLTDSVINIPPEKVSEVQFVTQPRIDDARPDIQIASPGCLVYVEVKVSSSLKRKQVDDYLARLAKSDSYPNTCLVLLTQGYRG
jgi:hypothetical protein